MNDITVNLLRLHDGTLIDPSTKQPIVHGKDSDEESKEQYDTLNDDDGVEDLDIIPLHRRSIMDLSLTAQQLAFVNNVLVYSLWGLPDDEIMMQCQCTLEQLNHARNLEDYTRIKESLIQGLQASLMQDVDNVFAMAAPKAARSLVRNLKAKSPDIRMSAMKDILDRAGHRPADRVEHMHNIGDGSELVIRVIKQDEANAIPTIDLKPNA